jgi:Putative Ig domain
MGRAGLLIEAVGLVVAVTLAFGGLRRATRRVGWKRGAAALVGAALVAGVLAVGTGVAGAGACNTVASGEWLGTWGVSASAGNGGVVKFDLTFTNTTVSGTMEFATGQTALAADSAVVGTRDPGSCNFTAEIAGLVTINAVVTSGDAGITGGWIYHPPASPSFSGTWQVGRVTSSASGTGTDLTTDPGNVGVSTSVPIVSSVSSPVSGPITIDQAVLTGGSQQGFSILDTIVRVTAPSGTPEAPLALTFEIDRSVTGGLDPSSLTVYRNGLPVALCLGATPPISLDPCVSVREPLTPPLDGVRFTILTSEASTWAFATPNLAPTGLRVTTATLPPARLGHIYSQRLDATGGNPPFKWKKAGKLPKGLKLNSKTGVIAGTPKKRTGTFTFTVLVKYKTKAKHQKPVKYLAARVLSIKVVA